MGSAVDFPGSLRFILTSFQNNYSINVDESDGSFGKQIIRPLGLFSFYPMAFFVARAISGLNLRRSRKGGISRGRRTGEMVQ
jgi:hypothetical protein